MNVPVYVIGLVVATTLSATAQTRKPKPAAPAIEGELGRRLDAHMKGLDAQTGGFYGSLLCAVGGKVVVDKGYGSADDAAKTPVRHDAMWDWASVSKQFTAAAILKLEMLKKLKLTDPLKKFFPEVPADKASVTLKDLLTHTSGIESGFKREWKFDAFDRESFVDLFLGLKMASPPGEAFKYSNSSYTFVGAVIERVTGETYEEWSIKNLFRPAGMVDACCIGSPSLDIKRVPKDDRGRGVPFAYGEKLSWGYRACGGVVATCRDMLAWDRALRGDKVLDKAAKEAFYKPCLENYALGWRVRTGKTGLRVEHSGGVGKTVTNYVRLIDEDVVIAVAYGYIPSLPPHVTCEELIEIIRKAK